MTKKRRPRLSTDLPVLAAASSKLEALDTAARKGVSPGAEVAPAQRWQHGSAAYAAPASPQGPRLQRVSVGLDALRAAGLIESEDETAATRYQRDYDLAFFGASARDKLGIRPEGGDLCSAADAHAAARIDAMTRYREAAQSVGILGEQVLLGLLVLRLGFGPLGEKIGWQRQDVRGACVLSLKRLSEHYREADKVRGRRAGSAAAEGWPQRPERVPPMRQKREPMVVISSAFRPDPGAVTAAIERLRNHAQLST